ncbi:MAG: hypothetical protein CSB48_12815 [Proteobacteria bacterium]|nr:MAG: hypothetical protein CSB48_12815 [Pseudomonadota bacterium]PIE40428.1 MAG: hypothetical protein CSA51_00845 [Gammaproteobacteria bacterium]
MNQASPGRSQKGLSSFTMLFVMVAMATFFLIGIKVVPMFMDNATVNSVVVALDSDPEVKTMADEQIRNKVMKMLTLNNIRFLKAEQIVIKREDGLLKVNLDYEVRENIFRNLDAVAVFENHYETRLPNDS